MTTDLGDDPIAAADAKVAQIMARVEQRTLRIEADIRAAWERTPKGRRTLELARHLFMLHEACRLEPGAEHSLHALRSIHKRLHETGGVMGTPHEREENQGRDRKLRIEKRSHADAEMTEANAARGRIIAP
jgi:hypothetical protein